jgi:hypothetical protein
MEKKNRDFLLECPAYWEARKELRWKAGMANMSLSGLLGEKEVINTTLGYVGSNRECYDECGQGRSHGRVKGEGFGRVKVLSLCSGYPGQVESQALHWTTKLYVNTTVQRFGMDESNLMQCMYAIICV